MTRRLARRRTLLPLLVVFFALAACTPRRTAPFLRSSGWEGSLALQTAHGYRAGNVVVIDLDLRDDGRPGLTDQWSDVRVRASFETSGEEWHKASEHALLKTAFTASVSCTGTSTLFVDDRPGAHVRVGGALVLHEDPRGQAVVHLPFTEVVFSDGPPPTQDWIARCTVR